MNFKCLQGEKKTLKGLNLFVHIKKSLNHSAVPAAEPVYLRAHIIQVKYLITTVTVSSSLSPPGSNKSSLALLNPTNSLVHS